MQKSDSFWMFQFEWLQHKRIKTLIVQIIYIDKPLGTVSKYNTVPDLIDRLRKEHSDKYHTRPRMLVSFWNLYSTEHTFEFDEGGWLENPGDSTKPDWPWTPFDINIVAGNPQYNIKCHDQPTNTPMMWHHAMDKIKKYIQTDRVKDLHFHPRQRIDTRCYHLAKQCNVMVFLLHLDGIVMYHLLTHDKEYITIGFLLLNLVPNAKTSKYYFRISILPKGKAWTFPVMFKLIQKEIDSWKKGFPLPDRDYPGKFVMVYPVFLGILADGKEICKMLNKMELTSYAGALFLKECIRLNPKSIGTEDSPCFISRRFLTNSVSFFFLFLFFCYQVHNYLFVCVWL